MRKVLRLVVVVVAVVLPGWGLMASGVGAANDRPASPEEAKARGLEYAGLRRDARCADDEFLVEGVGDGAVRCTHGPDPAPHGVDVRSRDPLAETSGGTSSTSTGAVPCTGDGVSGNRVQAVYAHASDVADRYPTALSYFRTWAGNVDATFVDSAAKTGGVRHVRWVTDSNCLLDVINVQLSTRGDDSYSNMVSELQAKGLKRTDRKYLVWADANIYCGLGDFPADNTSGSANVSNKGPHYTRVDLGCWGMANSVEAHELMHTLGGISNSAPHSSGGGHCTDENDRMCYSDASGVTLTYVCPPEQERLFDCNDDDYFSTAPVAGSWLATHWNTADNVFLDGSAAAATTDPAPTPAPAPTSTSPTTTTTSGSLTRKAPSQTYAFSTSGGAVKTELTFSSKVRSMTVTVEDSSGTVVAQGQGPSVLRVTASLPAGSYSVVVGGAMTTYTLAVTATA
jgi:hypothetical protein